MFVYCGNNPVSLFDPTGTTPADAQVYAWKNPMAMPPIMPSLNMSSYASPQSFINAYIDYKNAMNAWFSTMNSWMAGYNAAYNKPAREKKKKDYSGVLIGAGTTAAFDSPAPGLADLAAVGVLIIGGIAVLASNPNDLKRGMSKYQKGMFQREIEGYKSDHGMPPDYNLPWDILVALAEYVKETFKK